MQTVTINIINEKAMRILQDLEDLHLIRVLKKKLKTTEKLSSKYAGKLPPDIANELQKFVTQSREEWNRQDI